MCSARRAAARPFPLTASIATNTGLVEAVHKTTHAITTTTTKRIAFFRYLFNLHQDRRVLRGETLLRLLAMLYSDLPLFTPFVHFLQTHGCTMNRDQWMCLGFCAAELLSPVAPAACAFGTCCLSSAA